MTFLVGFYEIWFTQRVYEENEQLSMKMKNNITFPKKKIDKL